METDACPNAIGEHPQVLHKAAKEDHGDHKGGTDVVITTDVYRVIQHFLHCNNDQGK